MTTAFLFSLIRQRRKVLKIGKDLTTRKIVYQQLEIFLILENRVVVLVSFRVYDSLTEEI